MIDDMKRAFDAADDHDLAAPPTGAVRDALKSGASVPPAPEPTDADILAIEQDVGMSNRAWDMVPATKLIRAAWKRLLALSELHHTHPSLDQSASKEVSIEAPATQPPADPFAPPRWATVKTDADIVYGLSHKLRKCHESECGDDCDYECSEFFTAGYALADRLKSAPPAPALNREHLAKITGDNWRKNSTEIADAILAALDALCEAFASPSVPRGKP